MVPFWASPAKLVIFTGNWFFPFKAMLLGNSALISSPILLTKTWVELLWVSPVMSVTSTLTS